MTRFERVSAGQFAQDGGDGSAYDQIKLPARATTGSAGYDFFAPSGFTLLAGESKRIASGIRCQMDDGLVLMLFPRSGLGFKYRLMLNNTVGIIDSDYYFAENEGHILIKLTNSGDKPLSVESGQAFAQGIFLNYATTDDDKAMKKRTGGFGSTG